MATKPHPNDYAAPRRESFDAIFVKKGVAPHAAKPEEFRRELVSVDEGGAYAARACEDVVNIEKQGWDLFQVVQPGQRTEAETIAAQRAHDAAYGTTDPYNPI